MLRFPGLGRGLGQQLSPHSCFVLFNFFPFFNFLKFFFKLSCGCDMFMFIVVFFCSLLVNIRENIYMLF